MRHRLLAGLKRKIFFRDHLNIINVSMRHRLLAGLKPVASLPTGEYLLCLNEAPPACRIETSPAAIAYIIKLFLCLNEAPPACRIETRVNETNNIRQLSLVSMRHRLLAGLKLFLLYFERFPYFIVSMRHRLLAGLKRTVTSDLPFLLSSLNEASPACRIETASQSHAQRKYLAVSMRHPLLAGLKRFDNRSRRGSIRVSMRHPLLAGLKQAKAG